MSDRYQELANSALGGFVSRRVGLPVPPRLARYEPGQPVVAGTVVLGGARRGLLEGPAGEVLRSLGTEVITGPVSAEAQQPAAIVYDAGAIDEPARLRSLYEFLSPIVYRLRANGRVIVLAGMPGEAADAEAAVAQRAIEGFTRSVAKEVGNKGSTANLVRVAAGGEGAIESTLRFLLSARSAYISGQVFEIESVEAADVVVPGDWEQPLAGRVAAVTGSARGIGEAIATTLARDGAELISIDVPAAGGDLTAVSNRIGATALQLDITDAGAPSRLADHVAERHGRLDAIVHNAGITRDKTLGRMQPEQWDAVLEVNLASQLRLNEPLLERDLIGAGGRLISVSSVSGIAGNRGQTNYATSKAGIIGMVEALAAAMRARGATINAVAPGFIETRMTGAMPIATREAGRRMNSLLQAGLPADVAETTAWLASPASAGVNGNVVRVCGQALMGA